MASKVTRTALVAVSALGVSGLVATSAEAAAPTIPSSLVSQPTAAGVTNLTPESATLTGVIDTGGDTQSTFTVPANTLLTWANSFNLNGGSAGAKELVNGIPQDLGYSTYPTSAAGTLLYNNAADNYSTVLFEYDTAADYAANGNNLGPLTGYATETDVPTFPGLSPVSAVVGGYPAANATGISGALTPGTKYVYLLVQQAGATDAAEDINTATNGATTGTNPTYACEPDSYISSVAPYNTYTSTGTISGGLNSSGTAQTTPQPQIQGPCVFYFGGGANYYDSTVGTFTTPKLGQVVFQSAKVTAVKKTTTKTTGTGKQKKTVTTTTLTNPTATIAAVDQSVEATKGSIELTYAGKEVASATYSVTAGASKTLPVVLTAYGKTLIEKGKSFSTKLVYTTTTDQPSPTKNATL